MVSLEVVYRVTKHFSDVAKKTQENSAVGVCCTNSTTPVSSETTQSSRQFCVGDVKHNFVRLKRYKMREAEKVYNSILANQHIDTYIQAPLHSRHTLCRELPSPLQPKSEKTLSFLFDLET
jgi:hypothetical protein